MSRFNTVHVVGMVIVGAGIGVVLYGTLVGDNNRPATYTPSAIDTVHLCPGADLELQEALREDDRWRERGWDGLTFVLVDDCSTLAGDGIAQVHPWGDWTLTDGPVEETEHDGGWTIPRYDGETMVSAEVWLRSRTERQRLSVRHELGHVRGLALPDRNGEDGHDDHATRLMAKQPGDSWVGLDRGKDFEWRGR